MMQLPLAWRAAKQMPITACLIGQRRDPIGANQQQRTQVLQSAAIRIAAAPAGSDRNVKSTGGLRVAL
jgi:hypothetical protein